MFLYISFNFTFYHLRHTMRNVVRLRLWYYVRCIWIILLAIFHVHTLQSSFWYSWTVVTSEWPRPKEHPASMTQERGYLNFKRGKAYWMSEHCPSSSFYISLRFICDSSGVGTLGSSRSYLRAFNEEQVSQPINPFWIFCLDGKLTLSLALCSSLTEGCGSETGSRFLELLL